MRQTVQRPAFSPIRPYRGPARARAVNAVCTRFLRWRDYTQRTGPAHAIATGYRETPARGPAGCCTEWEGARGYLKPCAKGPGGGVARKQVIKYMRHSAGFRTHWWLGLFTAGGF